MLNRVCRNLLGKPPGKNEYLTQAEFCSKTNDSSPCGITSSNPDELDVGMIIVWESFFCKKGT